MRGPRRIHGTGLGTPGDVGRGSQARRPVIGHHLEQQVARLVGHSPVRVTARHPRQPGHQRRVRQDAPGVPGTPQRLSCQLAPGHQPRGVISAGSCRVRRSARVSCATRTIQVATVAGSPVRRRSSVASSFGSR